jgi:hypothetical protein
MQAVRSSEISVNFYQITRHHIPEDNSLHSHHCEVLKFDIIDLFKADRNVDKIKQCDTQKERCDALISCTAYKGRPKEKFLRRIYYIIEVERNFSIYA